MTVQRHCSSPFEEQPAQRLDGTTEVAVLTCADLCHSDGNGLGLDGGEGSIGMWFLVVANRLPLSVAFS